MVYLERPNWTFNTFGCSQGLTFGAARIQWGDQPALPLLKASTLHVSPENQGPAGCILKTEAGFSAAEEDEGQCPSRAG